MSLQSRQQRKLFMIYTLGPTKFSNKWPHTSAQEMVFSVEAIT